MNRDLVKFILCILLVLAVGIIGGGNALLHGKKIDDCMDVEECR